VTAALPLIAHQTQTTLALYRSALLEIMADRLWSGRIGIIQAQPKECRSGRSDPSGVASSVRTTRMRTKSIPALTLKQENRFWAHVAVPDQPSCCWDWEGRHGAEGYGRFRIWHNGVHGVFAAHRIIYTLLVGDIPDGLTIDHLCRNVGCVNPDHMEVVSVAVNNARSYNVPANNKRKTHCKHGHPLAGSNLYVHPVTGYRNCRTCLRADYAAYRSRKRVAMGLPPESRNAGIDFATRAYCLHGHELTEENTWFKPGSPVRRCRICRRESGRRSSAKSRERDT
jgi:hypothetical protein